MPPSKATSTADRRPSRSPTFRFVGGKGGVGKTTCAAAFGLLAARAGRSTLIVSTDPAPSLGDALEQRLTRRPRPIRGVSHLEAVEVDARAALAEWLERRRGLLEEIALRGTWLDADDVARLMRLSLPGIDEIAGLLQVAELADTGRYDHIVVDSAPTGHLLRMLGMPAVLEGLAQVFDRMQAKHRIMVEALRGGWTPDAADALLQELDEQARRLETWLRDPAQCAVGWVTLPERMAIEEMSDGLRALKEKNITVDRVIVNRMTPPPRGPCRWCDGRRRLEREAFLGLVRRVEGAGVAVATVPAVGKEPRGIAALRGLGVHLTKPAARPGVRRSSGARRITAALPAGARTADATAIVPRGTELLLFGGKGGVGKTTCAAAAAITAAMSSSDLRVLLLSADPAHSVGDVLEAPVTDDPRRIAGGPPNLLVRELDARRAFSALRDRLAEGIDELIVRTGGSAVDRQAMRDLLELAPPGVDELAAIIDVTETLGVNAATGRHLIVVDTAPTGHALRLLEMPALVHDWVKAMMAILLKYQPAVGLGGLGAVLLRLSQGLGRLRALLRDPTRTCFAVVTRAASLPRAESLRLLARLRDAAIPAPLVIVNAVGAGTCPRCRTEQTSQQKEVLALSRELTRRGAKPLLLLAPGVVPPPSGCADLRAFLAEWRPQRLTRQ